MTRALLATAMLLAAPSLPGQAPLTIQIDGAAPRRTVSPSLYGIFFEEINHSGEGGLYAEMVLNRDFEINTLPAGARWAGNLLRTKEGWQERKWFGNSLHGWKLVAEVGAQGSIRLATAQPLNPRNPQSMRLTMRASGHRLGVANQGFLGMSFERGKWYDLTFFARTDGNQTFRVAAALESASGRETWASAEVTGVGGGWKRYTCSLRATESDHNGRLTLAIDHPGSIWFDVVSLFPRDTFKGRPNGLRPDLAQLLADLKPAFVRFPGGAIVGGLNLDNRIQWRNSIGPIEQRKGTMNLWGYWTSNGLGFHEYLQMCEDLDADALWVCNPGFSDNYRKAEYASPEQVPAFVEEAMDALEYALGPADSKWGAQRAANGHRAPFRLRYIEIGNEAGGKEYEANYRLFYQAIKAKYPRLVIISNQRYKGDPPVEVVDDHKYGTPQSFFAAADRYDQTDRSGPKVYVGEYGCNSGVGEGNLMAALSEAAYLIGLERNGDVVTMSSYAPLLFHVDDIAWPVNLIGFDSARAVGRSSYHVQKLFARNRPDEALASRVEPHSEAKDREVFATAGVDRKRNELVIKAVNRAAQSRAVTIRANGLGPVAGTARVTTLSHQDPDAENTLDEPDVVLPVEAAHRVAGPVFSYTLRAHSLTVLRVALPR